MQVYRISPIGYDPQILSLLLKKDDKGNCYLLLIRTWCEISNEQYEEVIKTAINDEEHFEINQIQ